MVKTSNPDPIPPIPLIRERVLQAALRLADEEGHVIEGNYDGLHDFEFGLELILDGLDRLRHLTD